jgi:hypothetical protein
MGRCEAILGKGGKQAVSRVLLPSPPSGPGRLGDGGGSSLSSRRYRRPPAAHVRRNGTSGQPLFRGPKPWPCSWPGFTEPAPLDAAGALLPHLCTLACAPEGPSAVCFCGTLLTVSRTGRYPAGLAIGEPGLSSTRSPPLGSALSRSGADRDHLTCFLLGSLGPALAGGRTPRGHERWLRPGPGSSPL